MTVEEYLVGGFLLTAGIVVAVDVRLSKRRRPREAGTVPAAIDIAGSPTPHAQPTVLVVAATMMMRLSLRRALEEAMTVVEANNAAEGLAHLNGLGGDAADLSVVIDLPSADDHRELLRVLGSDPRFAQARVVVVLPEGAAQPAAAGSPFVVYLARPASPKAALQRILSPR